MLPPARTAIRYTQLGGHHIRPQSCERSRHTWSTSKFIEYILSNGATLASMGLYTGGSGHKKRGYSHGVPAALKVPEHAINSIAFQEKCLSSHRVQKTIAADSQNRDFLAILDAETALLLILFATNGQFQMSNGNAGGLPYP
jgi:hypothetical protein